MYYNNYLVISVVLSISKSNVAKLTRIKYVLINLCILWNIEYKLYFIFILFQVFEYLDTIYIPLIKQTGFNSFEIKYLF